MPEHASPALMMKRLLDDELDAGVIPGGVFVGGADDDAQQAGCVALMDAGSVRTDDAPLLWKRIQIRCMGRSLLQVDGIGNHVYSILKRVSQETLTRQYEDEDGYLWLVHGAYPSTEPSHHIDSSETWESLLFGVVKVGEDPIGTPAP